MESKGNARESRWAPSSGFRGAARLLFFFLVVETNQNTMISYFYYFFPPSLLLLRSFVCWIACNFSCCFSCRYFIFSGQKTFFAFFFFLLFQTFCVCSFFFLSSTSNHQHKTNFLTLFSLTCTIFYFIFLGYFSFASRISCDSLKFALFFLALKKLQFFFSLTE